MAEFIKLPKVFISYAWEDDVKAWVLDFATRLRKDGVDVVLDLWEMSLGDQITVFMEKSVRNSDFVILVCSPKYKRKSDDRAGGVGYEGHIITSEIFSNSNHRKFIPVLRKDTWIEASPSWAQGKIYVDLSGNPYSEDNYQDLLKTLYGKREPPPPLGTPPDFSSKGGTKKDVSSDVTEKNAREKTDREAAEKIARDKAEREASERRRLAEKAAKEKEQRDLAEKNKRISYAPSIKSDSKKEGLSRYKVPLIGGLVIVLIGMCALVVVYTVDQQRQSALATQIATENAPRVQVLSLGDNADPHYNGHIVNGPAAISPDNLRLATGNGSAILITNLITDILEKDLLPMGEVYSNSITSIAWSPDGKYLAASVYNVGFKWWVWDTANWNVIQKVDLGLDSDNLISLDWSPDGQQIATTDGSNISIWSPFSGKELRTITSQKSNGCAYYLDWSLDGKHLAGSGCDETIYVWSTESGKMEKQDTNHDWAYWTRILWSPDSSRLAMNTEDYIGVLNLSDSNRVNLLHETIVDGVRSMAWSKDGKRIAGCTGDVTVWDTGTGQVDTTLYDRSQGYNCTYVFWALDGTYLGELTHDDKILYWTMPQQKP